MVSQEIVGLNIVIVMDNIDTSIFNQYWFIQNKVILPEEMQGSSVFVPGLTNIGTEDCQIVVTPQNIQFVIKTSDINKSYDCIKKRFSKMVDAMPMIPLKAIGLNINWKVMDDSKNIPVFSKECFYNEGSSIYSNFKNKDARFGAYFSQSYDYNTRLKLDIKPVLANTPQGDIEFMLASFNYHRALSRENRLNEVKDQLKKWSNVIQNSKKIACSLI